MYKRRLIIGAAFVTAALICGGTSDAAPADGLVRMQPDHAENHLTRGAAYGNQGEDDQGIADYHDAIRLNSNDADAYCNRGMPTAAKGRMTRG